jgi:beta-lactam-binding protein with PASTA domain
VPGPEIILIRNALRPIAAVVILAVCSCTSSATASVETVPNVLGLSYIAAKARLHQENLGIDNRLRMTLCVPNTVVTRQVPKPGVRVHVGTRVAVDACAFG